MITQSSCRMQCCCSVRSHQQSGKERVGALPDNTRCGVTRTDRRAGTITQDFTLEVDSEEIQERMPPSQSIAQEATATSPHSCQANVEWNEAQHTAVAKDTTGSATQFCKSHSPLTSAAYALLKTGSRCISDNSTTTT